MSDYDFDFGPVWSLLKWLLIVAVPLAIWKLVDIAIWLAKHLTIGVQ